jgi:hypothetical protein
MAERRFAVDTLMADIAAIFRAATASSARRATSRISPVAVSSPTGMRRSSSRPMRFW